ncbi:MAG: transcription elongation factor GreA [Candidatus Omnitrophica bacterium]|nr:transcription elongation factor GreA [Candidatus Omnitrophota bacterium]
MANEVYLTRKGFLKLQEQLESLMTTERQKIAKAIGEARAQGDISENAEYDAAKDAQAHNESRIAELESKLTNVRIIENENIPSDKIFIGAIVSLKDLDNDEELTYTLVSPEEASYEEGTISIFSPIGKGLLGHKAGETVAIKVPAGILNYKIKKISRLS